MPVLDRACAIGEVVASEEEEDHNVRPIAMSPVQIVEVLLVGSVSAH